MKKNYAFRLDMATMEKARERATKENRTLTNWMETIIKNALEKKGRDPVRDHYGDMKPDAG